MQRVHKTVPTKSRTFCSVPKCSSYITRDVSLHKFPLSDDKLCKQWQVKLKISKPITKYMMVCSKHFLKKDFFYGEIQEKMNIRRRRLKKNSIPSQNLPVSCIETRKEGSKCITEKCEERGEEAMVDSKLCCTSKLLETVQLEETIVTNVEKCNKPSHFLNDEAAQNLHDFNFTCDKCTQTEPVGFELPELLKSDKTFNSFTGINMETLNKFRLCTENVGTECHANIQNLQRNIILVLCKLKLNISFKCLAALFRIGDSMCSDIFYSTVSLLSASLKRTIYFPNKEEVLANMPKCFERFSDTRLILDCIEIRFQKLKNMKSQVMSYSHYKGNHTAKFLVGITPSGLISYVSKAYDGWVTDEAIFNNENVISKLVPYDAVMVDKGILIRKECKEFPVKVHQPLFLQKKKQLPKEDAKLTVEIARARVHVERTIQRIKIFKIFHEQISWYMIPYIDDIIIIIAACVNMSSHILASHKFKI